MPSAEQQAKNGESLSNPVFVVGVLRSGTSLLYALLNQHPQVALMYECDVWNFPETFRRMRLKGNWLQRQEFFNKALSRHRLIFGDSLRGLEDVHAPEDLYRTFSEGKDKTLFGEKSPFYCMHLRRLVRHYPGCRFILLWRDPIEIYRSVIRAARKERYFRRSGILNRLVFYEEQMTQQATELERAGVRLCHVTYADLMDNTEETCRRICQFLGVEFDEKMLDLSNADLSAVYPGPEHDHLRRGRIVRQKFAGEAENEIIPAADLKKLRRFNARWRRLQSQWLGHQTAASSGEPEPAALERLYSRITGMSFRALDDGKRLLFEFLPLPWLRGYRLMKKNFSLRCTGKRPSLREQVSSHGITILASYLVLACVAVIDFLTGPNLTMAPFYLLSPAILALIVGRRWGIFAAIIAVVYWSALQNIQLKGSLEWGIVAWNSVMRLVVLSTVVLLLDRGRGEPASASKADI